MKRIIPIIVAALICTPAFANSYKVNLTSINCEAEKDGSTKVCVVNETKTPVIGVACDGHIFGTTSIAIPGGGIPPGRMTIINFNRGACHSTLYIETADKQIHTQVGQDIGGLDVIIIDGDY